MSKTLTWNDAPSGFIVIAISISLIGIVLESGSDCNRTATAASKLT